MEAVCKCGKMRFASEMEAHKAQPDARFKCPDCHTFARDHKWTWNGDPDCNRCGDCDTREWSHGG